MNPSSVRLRERWERFCRRKGEDHPKTLEALEIYLNELCREPRLISADSPSRLEETAGLLQKYLGGVCRTRTGWEQDPKVLSWMLLLARIRFEQDRLPEAQVLAEGAVLRMDRCRADTDTDISDALKFLAALFEKQEKWAEEGKIDRRIYEIESGKYGEKSPQAIQAMRALVWDMYRQGKYEEALRWARMELEARKETPGAGGRQLEIAGENYCACLQRTGRGDEEIAFRREQVFRTMTERSGSSPAAAEAMEKLLACLQRNTGPGLKGRLYAEYALRTAQDILRMRQRERDPDTDQVLKAMENVRNCQQKLRRFEEAAETQEAICRLRRETAAPDHTAVLDAGVILSELLFRCGRTEQAKREIEALLPVLLKAPGEHGGRILRLRVLQQWIQEGEAG